MKRTHPTSNLLNSLDPYQRTAERATRKGPRQETSIILVNTNFVRADNVKNRQRVSKAIFDTCRRISCGTNFRPLVWGGSDLSSPFLSLNGHRRKKECNRAVLGGTSNLAFCSNLYVTCQWEDNTLHQPTCMTHSGR